MSILLRGGLPRRSLSRLILLAIFLTAILTLVRTNRGRLTQIIYHGKTSSHPELADPGGVEKAIVTAKMPEEDVQWIFDLKPDWEPFVYTASQPPEPGYPLIPPGYRGREAVTYLDFIVRYYERLPEIVAFVHAKPEQWHNEDIGPRTDAILKNLRLDAVRKLGYLNFRCKHEPGCPVGVNPFEPTEIDVKGKDIRAYFVDVYMELFNVRQSEVPAHVGNVCCGQFAVTRAQIRKRSKKDYERMLRWTLESDITDSFGIGWVFEKIWHIIFGMEAQYCPTVEECRCNLFGWCGPLPENCIQNVAAGVEKAVPAPPIQRQPIVKRQDLREP